MESLARLLLFALTEFRPAERLSAGASRITTAAVCSAAAVVALTGALACLVTAGWIALVPVVGQAGAALCAAGGLAAAALVLWLIARSRGPHAHHHEDPPASLSGLEGLQDLLAQGLGPELKRLFAENKIPVILAALIAGMALGGGGPGSRGRD